MMLSVNVHEVDEGCVKRKIADETRVGWLVGWDEGEVRCEHEEEER